MVNPIIIGTILPECLHSLASALKFDGISPVPDTTKRMTASMLITRGSWPTSMLRSSKHTENKNYPSQKNLACIYLVQIPVTKRQDSSCLFCFSSTKKSDRSHLFFVSQSSYHSGSLHPSPKRCVVVVHWFSTSDKVIISNLLISLITI